MRATRFQPLGMEGEKKLSDFLIDLKVPLIKKRETLVVADGYKIGPGLRNADR